MISAIVFDIGNVLVRFDFSRAMARLEAESTARMDDVKARLIEVKDEYEAGRMGKAEFLAAAIELLEYRAGPEKFEEVWREIFDENFPMTSIIPELAGRFPLFLLSNTSDLHMDYIRATYPIFTHLPHGVYSYEARSSKPESAIYQTLLERFGLKAEEVVFVDDLEANIKAAQALGFQTVHYDFRNHEEGERRLRELIDSQKQRPTDL